MCGLEGWRGKEGPLHLIDDRLGLNEAAVMNATTMAKWDGGTLCFRLEIYSERERGGAGYDSRGRSGGRARVQHLTVCSRSSLLRLLKSPSPHSSSSLHLGIPPLAQLFHGVISYAA